MDNGLSSIQYILSVLFEIKMYLDGLNISSCIETRYTQSCFKPLPYERKSIFKS